MTGQKMNEEIALQSNDARWVPSKRICIAPIIISVVCGIIFWPFRTAEGDPFSPLMCIISGVMLTYGLFLSRLGRLKDNRWLVIMILTFIYECLPINLPATIDDVLALSTSGINFFLMHVVGINLKVPKSTFSRGSCSSGKENEVIDV